MGILDGVWQSVARNIVNLLDEQGDQRLKRLGDYFGGSQKKPLKVKTYDDNIVLNFSALSVWRSVSRTLRGGVNWELEDDASVEYLDAVWKANHKDTLLLQGGLHSAVFGTGYFEIVPDAKTDNVTGNVYPSLIPLDPQKMTIEVNPHDIGEVLKYTMQYSVGENDFKKVTRREDETWVIEYWIRNKLSGNKWVLDPENPPVAWLYPFAPIVHWKNLPSINNCYGTSDIEDVIAEGGAQDKTNFIYSNINAIVRQQAHKQPYTIGMPPKTQLDTGPGKMLNFPAQTTVGQMDANADLTASANYAHDIRQSLFDLVREVDISSITDKTGALTNFGLRVLNMDAVDKTDTKRQLYGEAIEELNYRLLVLNNMQPDPGKVVWGEPLPVNVIEDLQADQVALGMGIVSKEAVYRRYAERYGTEDWEEMRAQIEGEQKAASLNNDNVGAMLLRNFNRGGEQMQQEQMQQRQEANGPERQNR